jgi:hypothetical protein
MSNENLTILVELFGPLREYGTSVCLPVDEPLPFSGLLDHLEKQLGIAFHQRVLRENITYILNNRVVDRDGSEDPMVSPGDRVAFALLLGGG